MFRDIRRKKNEISVEMAENLLRNERRGVLSLIGDNGYPYGVPINFVYDEETKKIYFHGARVGHKVDSIKKCNKVCFTVYGNETIKDENWAPYVQSVIAFGRCKLINNQDEGIELTRKLAAKYYPDKILIEEEISASGKAVQMFEMEIEHISGKEIQER